MSVQLYLDGVLMPIKGIIGKVSMELTGKDMSGQSSSTDFAETGTKAKKLRYSGLCLTPSAFKAVYEASIKTDETGKRHIYRINQNTANALKIRQVRFQGEMKSNGDNVFIELTEVLSIPERKEQREPDKIAHQQEYNGGIKTEINTKNNEENIPPLTKINLDKFIKINNENIHEK